jgi:hypothetical protein
MRPRVLEKICGTTIAILLAASAWGQGIVKVTNVYSLDYLGQPGVPEVGDPFVGVGSVFTLSGDPNTKYSISIQIRCGVEVAEWDNYVSLTPGTYYSGWAAFRSELESPVPATFKIWITGSSSQMAAKLPVKYPAHAIEIISPNEVLASISRWVKYKENSGAVAVNQFMFGEPQLTSTQGPTISYTPPTGATEVITKPLGIPVQSVEWQDLDTAISNQLSAEESFATTLHNSRVNPNIMRTVPWAAIDSKQPPDIEMWQQSETFVPTNAKEITELVNAALPTGYRSTMTPWDAARAVFAAVVRHIKYGQAFDPLVAWDKKEGQCEDFAWLFAVGLRRLGFASRTSGGFWLGNPATTHMWSEFYMPGAGWVPADPCLSNQLDPTGTYLYQFGTVTNLNSRVSDWKSENVTWPGIGWDISDDRIPWWYWSGGATYVSDGWNANVALPKAVSLSPVTPDTYPNGRMFAQVGLQNPAPASGTTVKLSSSSSAAKVPPSVFLYAGWSATSFPISIGLVSTDTPVTIAATAGSDTQRASFTIHPRMVTAGLNYKFFVSNENPQVNVTLSSPASTDTVIRLISNVVGWGLPSSLTVPAGSVSSSVSWPLPVSVAPVGVKISATLNGQSDSDTALAAPRPIGLFLPGLTVKSGQTAQLNVQLAAPAPVGGLTITFVASPGALRLGSSSTTIPAGATSAVVAVSTGTVTTETPATITAKSALGTAAVALMIKP